MKLLRKNKSILLLLVVILFAVSGCSSSKRGIDETTKTNIDSINKLMETEELESEDETDIALETEATSSSDAAEESIVLAEESEAKAE